MVLNFFIQAQTLLEITILLAVAMFTIRGILNINPGQNQASIIYLLILLRLLHYRFQYLLINKSSMKGFYLKTFEYIQISAIPAVLSAMEQKAIIVLLALSVLQYLVFVVVGQEKLLIIMVVFHLVQQGSFTILLYNIAQQRVHQTQIVKLA